MSHPDPQSCPFELEDITTCLSNIDGAKKIITDSLAAIDRATKVISDNQVRLSALIHKPNDSREDDDEHHSDKPQSHPDLKPSGGDLRCPDCGKENADEKARRRHYATHILCAKISTKDVECVCCGKPMKTASNFNKNHAKCSEQMADQLSETTRLEAFQQKRRINDAVKDSLNKKRAWDGEGSQGLPKKRNAHATSALQISRQSDNETYISGLDSYSAAVIDLSLLPNLQAGSNQAARYQNLHDMTTIGEAADSTTTGLHVTTHLHGADLHSTTSLDDGYFRGLAMVLNPMDGLLDWGVPNT